MKVNNLKFKEKVFDMIVIWGKKSLINDEPYDQLYINKNHIVSIDLLDYIQINLVNGMIYYTWYDPYLSMISLGLMDEIDTIMYAKGFKKDNPDFDLEKYKASFPSREN